MIKVYKVRGLDIEPVEAERMTDKSVWLIEKNLFDGRSRVRRAAIVSDYHCYFETKAAAVEHVRSVLVRSKARAEIDLSRITERLETFNAMYPEVTA